MIQHAILEGRGSAPEERSLLVHKAISSHLKALNYPQKSINSMLRCGQILGKGYKFCNCKTELQTFIYRCNLRTCESCSKIRRRRIFNRFLPFFKMYQVTSKDFFQFLTISPKNYRNLEEGFNEVKKDFAKFMRRKYISERIKAGFYVIEAKQNIQGLWNVHIHAVIYGRWIDYRLRGKCMQCRQNLLKFNKYKKKFYCANKKCNSPNVIRYKDTKVCREWRESSGSSSHIYGERVGSYVGAVSYLTKYVGSNKDSFNTLRDKAVYINCMRKKRLINSFGLFFKERKKLKKPVHLCDNCGTKIRYVYDFEVSIILMENEYKPPDDRLSFYVYENGM